MKKGSFTPEVFARCAAGERALALALQRTGKQVTYRELAEAWDDANAAHGVALPNPPYWLALLKPGIAGGRVGVTQVDGKVFFTLFGSQAYPLPERPQVAYKEKRLEIAASAERALRLALNRAGEQVTWVEVRAAWCEANGVGEAPYPSATSWGWVFEPLVRSGRVVTTRCQGRCFYALANGQEYAIPRVRPRFTPKRMETARRAECALALALRRAGEQVTWEAIHAAWEEANGDPGQYGKGQCWWWVFAPSLEAGRVIKTERGNSVYYTFTDGPEYPLSAGPKYSALRLAQCSAGERALAVALIQAGEQVRWQAIRGAWKEANGDESGVPANRVQGWSDLFAPAVEAGRVFTTKQGRGIYYTLALGPVYSRPKPGPRPPRAYGPQLRARAEAAERALIYAVNKAKLMVETIDLVVVWEDANRSPCDRTPTNLGGDLEPAVAAGRVRVVRQNRHVYYAPADRPDLIPPRFAGDLHRTEEAVRRAATRLKSAVPYAEVQREVEADPELTLRGATPLGNCMRTLVHIERLRTARHLGRENPGGLYYTHPGGPRWVRREVEYHQDRRFRAVQGLWSAASGRPFTTRAVRRFASMRASLRFQGDPPHGWTNALHHLLANGDVVQIPGCDEWHVRWAPKAAWEALTPEQRDDRTRDCFGREVDPENPELLGPFGPDPDAPEHDVNYVSRAKNLRTLVLAAKVSRSAADPNPKRRQILNARPVELDDLYAAARLRPAIARQALATPAGARRRTLTHTVQDACRTRAGVKRPALAHLGVVGRTRFVDVKATEAGHAYVAYRAALHAAEPARSRRRVRLLDWAWSQSTTGIVSLPIVVLDTRARLLADDLTQRADALASAAIWAELLEEEAEDAAKMVTELRTMARQAAGVVSRSTSKVPTDEPVGHPNLSSPEANGQVRDLMPPPSNRVPPIYARLGLVGVVPAKSGERRGTRPIKHAIDRVGFACHAAAYFGGPSLASLAQQAWHAMGELRTPGPFVDALLDPNISATHAAAAAVLGFYDDVPSRAALVAYLWRTVEVSGHVSAGTTVVATEAAVLGLAPLPFGPCADELLKEEREIVLKVAEQGIDERLRRTAQRVLRAWNEGWDRDRLLHL